MRRYDTFTPTAKTAFFYTVEQAEDFHGKYHFICNTPNLILECEECPFEECPFNEDPCFKNEYEKTASEWLAWAGEEIID